MSNTYIIVGAGIAGIAGIIGIGIVPSGILGSARKQAQRQQH